VNERGYDKSTRGRVKNLRNGEVDGHLLTKMVIKGFKVGEEGALLEFLEISNSAARKVELEL